MLGLIRTKPDPNMYNKLPKWVQGTNVSNNYQYMKRTNRVQSVEPPANQKNCIHTLVIQDTASETGRSSSIIRVVLGLA